MYKMVTMESRMRRWGNSSLAFVIPKDVAEREKLKPNEKIQVVILKDSTALQRTFGALRGWPKSTHQIMREIDKELWQED